MERFDVIVVGAGTAGCMAAKTAAEKGLNVCLIDRKRSLDVGRKVCGDAVGRHHFDELGLAEPSGEEMERKILGIKIYSPNREVSYTVMGEGLHGYLINRHLFGQRLLKMALDSGATFLDSTQVLEPMIENKSVVGVTAKNMNSGEKLKILGKVTIDASGYTAILRSKLPPEIGVDSRVEMDEVEACYREIRELKEEIEDSDFCRIYLNQKAAPGGYVWIFPKKDNHVNVGLGVAMKGKFPNPKNQLYMNVLSMKIFEGSKIIDKGAWFVPTRRPLHSMAGNGVMIVGDAACQVNPIHGGGIGPSMVGGKLAAETAVAACEKGDFSLESLWQYNVRYMHGYGVKQAGLDIFRILLQYCSDEDLNYGMKYKLITEEDLLKASMGAEARFNITDLTMRIFRGLRRFGFLMKLREAANLMKRARELYRNYPENPKEFEKWKMQVEAIFQQAKSKLKP
ncbi:geranylgeranyl hydrogenase [Candidatus Bathyarchaeota archaeon]|nr:MAG: geranylgeranyl hydrogenase [Candidatus Bathyarchaeota archaeon]